MCLTGTAQSAAAAAAVAAATTGTVASVGLASSALADCDAVPNIRTMSGKPGSIEVRIGYWCSYISSSEWHYHCGRCSSAADALRLHASRTVLDVASYVILRLTISFQSPQNARTPRSSARELCRSVEGLLLGGLLLPHRMVGWNASSRSQPCTSATLSPCVKANHSTVALPMPPSHTQRKYMKKKSHTGSTVYTQEAH
jgi:hypothetical protein